MIGCPVAAALLRSHVDSENCHSIRCVHTPHTEGDETAQPLGDVRHSTHPSPLGLEAGLIPRAAFFISDFPFVALVRNRRSNRQQDLPDSPFSAAARASAAWLSGGLLPIGSPVCHFGRASARGNEADEPDHPNVFAAISLPVRSMVVDSRLCRISPWMSLGCPLVFPTVAMVPESRLSVKHRSLRSAEGLAGHR